MTDKPRILVVEDDSVIRDLVESYLSGHGLTVFTAAEARAMDRILAAEPIDLVILDLMLPGEGGLSICRRLRRDRPLPILLLTALGEDTDRIVGLESGADDYLVKPFNPRELLARVRAVLRRWEEPPGVERGGRTETLLAGRVRFDRWTVDLLKRQLYDDGGVRVSLTSGEFDLLVAFCRNPGKVLAREALLETTRGRVAAGPYDRSVDIMVSRLRRKLQSDSDDGGLIRTIRNVGYVFSAEVREVPDAGAAP